MPFRKGKIGPKNDCDFMPNAVHPQRKSGDKRENDLLVANADRCDPKVIARKSSLVYSASLIALDVVAGREN